MIESIHDKAELILWLKDMGLYEDGMTIPKVEPNKRFYRDKSYERKNHPFEQLVFSGDFPNHKRKQVRVEISEGARVYRLRLVAAEMSQWEGYPVTNLHTKRIAKETLERYLTSETKFVGYCTSAFEEYKLSLYKPKIVLITEESLLCP